MQTVTRRRRVPALLCVLSLGLWDCQCGENPLGQDPARTEVLRDGEPGTEPDAPLFPLRFGARVGDTIADEGFVAEDTTLFVTFNRHGHPNTRSYTTYSQTPEGTFLHASTREGLLDRPRLIAPGDARVGMTWRADTRGDQVFEFELEVMSKELEDTPWGEAFVWSIEEREAETGFEVTWRFVEGHGLWPRHTDETVAPLDPIDPPEPPEATPFDLTRLELGALENAVATQVSLVDFGEAQALLIDYDSYDYEENAKIEGARACLLLEGDGLREPDDEERARWCPPEGMHAGEVLGDAQGVTTHLDQPTRSDITYPFRVPYYDHDEDFAELVGARERLRTLEGYAESRLFLADQGTQDWTARALFMNGTRTLSTSPEEGAVFAIFGRDNALFTSTLGPISSREAPRLSWSSPRGVVAGTLALSSTLTALRAESTLTSILRDGRVLAIDSQTGAHEVLGRARLPARHTPLAALGARDGGVLVVTLDRDGAGVGDTVVWRAAPGGARAELPRHPIHAVRAFQAPHGTVLCWMPSPEELDTSGWTLNGQEPLAVLPNARGDCAYVLAHRRHEDPEAPGVHHVTARAPGVGRVGVTASTERLFAHDELLHVFEFEQLRPRQPAHGARYRSDIGEVRLRHIGDDPASEHPHWFVSDYVYLASRNRVVVASTGERPRAIHDASFESMEASAHLQGGGFALHTRQPDRSYELLTLAPDGATRADASRYDEEVGGVRLEGGGRCEWRWDFQVDEMRLVCLDPSGEELGWPQDATTQSPQRVRLRHPHLTALSPELFLLLDFHDLYLLETDRQVAAPLNPDVVPVGAACVSSDGRVLADLDGVWTWMHPRREVAQATSATTFPAEATSCQEVAPGVFWMEDRLGKNTFVEVRP
jgi:hypothetical protein